MIIPAKIDKVGVEIEGGWKRGHPVAKDIYGDGSVDIYQHVDVDEADCEENYKNICGEIHSDPLNDFNLLENWVRESYPNKTNNTCGLHIHVSTKSLNDYALLMHKKFHNIFLDAMEVWGKRYLGKRTVEDKAFWSRLKGNNEYCRREFRPIEQIEYDSCKYTILNYASFLDYKTLECRLFPAFKTVDKSILGISFFLSVIDDYLNTMKPNDYTKKYLQKIEKALE